MVKNTLGKGKNKTAKNIIFIVIYSLLSIIIIIELFIFVSSKLQQKLDQCLYDAENNKTGTELYDTKIACYQNMNPRKYSNEINELEADKQAEEYNYKLGLLKSCTNQAEANYRVTDDDLAAADNNIYITLNNLKKTRDGYQAQIDCFNKYDIDQSIIDSHKYRPELSFTNIDWLKAKKAEFDNLIETAEKSIENTPTRSSIHCSTDTIGTSMYTNCY